MAPHVQPYHKPPLLWDGEDNDKEGMYFDAEEVIVVNNSGWIFVSGSRSGWVATKGVFHFVWVQQCGWPIPITRPPRLMSTLFSSDPPERCRYWS